MLNFLKLKKYFYKRFGAFSPQLLVRAGRLRMKIRIQTKKEGYKSLFFI